MRTVSLENHQQLQWDDLGMLAKFEISHIDGLCNSWTMQSLTTSPGSSRST